MEEQQPHTNPQGIYKKGFEYFIKCGNLEVKPMNNSDSSIIDVFNNEIRIAGCKITLVDSLPDGVSRLENRTMEEVTLLSGNPLNIVELNNQLVLLLPRHFPELWINFNHDSQGWNVKVERSLIKNEMDILEEKVTQLGGYEANLTCDVDSNVKEHFEYKYQDPLSINVSKHSWDVKGITLDTTLELTNSAIPFAGFIVKQIGRLLKSKFHRTNPNVILVSGMRDKVKDLL